jgi:hypothetical protein
MSEERRQVLEMLVSGKVTVEQADQLLDALEPERPPEPVGSRSVGRQGERRGQFRGRSAAMSPEMLVPFKALAIDAAYVQQLRDAGLESLRPEILVRLRALGVDAAYVHELREASLENVTPEVLVSLRALGVDGAYIREMRASGLEDLSPEQLVALKAQGIGAGYVRQMHGWLAEQEDAGEE